MRKVIDMQMQIGEVPIVEIELDLQSRDEIPKLLIGLKSIYCNPQVWDEVSKVLMDLVPDNVSL